MGVVRTGKRHSTFTRGGETRPQGQKFHGGSGQGRYASAMPPSSLTLRSFSHDLASSFFRAAAAAPPPAPSVLTAAVNALGPQSQKAAADFTISNLLLPMHALATMAYFVNRLALQAAAHILTPCCSSPSCCSPSFPVPPEAAAAN